MAAYRAGEYQRAEDLARRATPPSESSRLVQGLAEQQLGKAGEAERTLSPLLSSRDRRVRGTAMATLGLIEQQRGDHERAARMLTDASDLLTGTDRVWAAHYAAVSHRATGNTAEAAALERVAGPAAAANAASLTAGGYTIQFGSFSTEARAARHQQAVTLLLRREGLPAPTVQPVQRGSRTLFAVRSGRFDSRQAATLAAAALPTETAVVGLN
ncbi:MAG: SPOR domain-containing protein [Phycisphaerales bacterium]